MRFFRILALACIATCLGVAAWAQPRSLSVQQIENWMSKKERPYGGQELYFAPLVHQETPQVRLITIEAAYTKKYQDSGVSYRALARMTPQAICQAYVETLQKRYQGATVRNHGCRAGVGLVKAAGRNTVHGAMSVHYRQGQTIAENLSMVITVCEPDEKYDPRQHLCVIDR